MESESEEKNVFSELTDDIVVNILYKLEDDPRHWARLACVSTKLFSLVRDFCWKTKCSLTIPSELVSGSDPPLFLHKLAVCCPGLRHAGLLFDSSDLGLERELGPDMNRLPWSSKRPEASEAESDVDDNCRWSLFDDLYYDTLYVPPEESSSSSRSGEGIRRGVVGKKRKVLSLSERACGSHLASGRRWSLSREQGSKLLARQFRDDCLYVCEWPGCVHKDERRKYCLFRGVFKNFKRTRVWRTIQDGNKNKLQLPCAFCCCNFTWDLHSAFCLRRGFGFHDDGEPVVRAYVCENGHVSGAWTDLPFYT